VREAGRVIAGVARGRRLRHPGPGTRPLADRVKQAVFGALEPRLPGARVLDLFAGSGAGGIEALSRGAASCDFVELDVGAARIIEENLRRTGLAGPHARVHRAEVAAFLARGGGPFDLVLVDPPFGDAGILDVLERLADGPLLRPGALVVVRHFWRDVLPERVGRLIRQRERRVGEGVVTIYSLAPDAPMGGAGWRRTDPSDGAVEGAADGAAGSSEPRAAG
jgi:16S rRNA (guanine966-N2)-methyltransferase